MVYHIFTKSDYSWKTPIENIRRFFWSLKLCRQRIANGFCDQDCRDIEAWFLGVFPEMLKKYREGDPDFFIGGYPSIIDEEYYEEHKKEIGVSYVDFRCYSESNRVQMWQKKCQKECDYRWRGKILPEMEKCFRLLNDDEFPSLQAKQECYDKAFTMLHKWFHCLWD